MCKLLGVLQNLLNSASCKYSTLFKIKFNNWSVVSTNIQFSQLHGPECSIFWNGQLTFPKWLFLFSLGLSLKRILFQYLWWQIRNFVKKAVFSVLFLKKINSILVVFVICFKGKFHIIVIIYFWKFYSSRKLLNWLI